MGRAGDWPISISLPGRWLAGPGQTVLAYGGPLRGRPSDLTQVVGRPAVIVTAGGRGRRGLMEARRLVRYSAPWRGTPGDRASGARQVRRDSPDLLRLRGGRRRVET